MSHIHGFLYLKQHLIIRITNTSDAIIPIAFTIFTENIFLKEKDEKI